PGRPGASPPSAYPATAVRRRSLFRAGCNFVRPFAFPESFLVTKRPLTAPIIERCHDFGTASPDSRVLGRYSLRPTSSWSSRSPLPPRRENAAIVGTPGTARRRIHTSGRGHPNALTGRRPPRMLAAPGATWGRLGLAGWIVEWPCTSAALLP